MSIKENGLYYCDVCGKLIAGAYKVGRKTDYIQHFTMEPMEVGNEIIRIDGDLQACARCTHIVLRKSSRGLTLKDFPEDGPIGVLIIKILDAQRNIKTSKLLDVRGVPMKFQE